MSEYTCFYCGYRINSQENLQKHKTECREAELAIGDQKCGDISNRQAYSFPHPLTLEPPSSYPPAFTVPVQVMCYTCNKEFKNKSELRRHFTSFHPDFKFFWCEICLANYGSERGLQTHMRNQHYVC